MARKAREKSPIGFYSIRLRTDTCQFDKTDRLLFLQTLNNYTDISELIAYCLLPSNFSFVIKTKDIDISTLMRKITVKFIRGYKKMHAEISDVFKDRYISKAAMNIGDVFCFVGKIHNFGLHGEETVCSYRTYETNPYINRNFQIEYSSDIDEFNFMCHIDTKDIFNAKVTDDEIKKYFESHYRVTSESVKNIQPNILLDMVAGDVKYNKATARQISRVLKIPMNLIWNRKREMAIKKILKNKRELHEN